jgi:hypothetical protein
VGAPDYLWEWTARLLSEATGISTENVASVKGLFSYDSTPVTNRGGNLCFLPTRVATVQTHVQEGLGFRTEDYVSARESLVLRGSHR